jgi:hypothetical protein
MVTRAATSGKGKFVPQTRTAVPSHKCTRTREVWLGVPLITRCKSIRAHLNQGFEATLRSRLNGILYFFNVEARKSTVRFHASAASAAR